MSFWGGFVEGFATTAKEEIDLDVAKTDKIVNDTVKIGVQKALDTQEEIKKDKKRIKSELEMLVGVGFSLPKAASIAKAGLSSTMAKLALDTDYKGKADGLWDGTTKFAQDNKLTVQDVVNKLSYQPPLDYGNLKVGSTQNSLLAAIGLSPNIDSRIQSGIKTRVGTLDTGVDRSDINILPGSLPTSVRSQFDTKKNMTIDQRILQLEELKVSEKGLTKTQDALLNRLIRIKNPSLDKLIAINQGENNKKLGAQPNVNMKRLKELDKLIAEGNDPDGKALEELRRILEDIAEKQGKDIALNILGQLEHGKPD
tara:strand:+ start:2706 stop:3641 length:936 start_codon:yes stop_codon:yes gene_type:complete